MESSLDPQLIEQTKKQIRELVSEITQLSRSDVAPAEFYSGFLTRVITALAANGGAIWTLADGSRLTLQIRLIFRKRIFVKTRKLSNSIQNCFKEFWNPKKASWLCRIRLQSI